MYAQHDFTPLEFSFFSCKILAISQAADLHADTQLSRWQVRNFVIAPRISALQTILYFGHKVALSDRAKLTSISAFLGASYLQILRRQPCRLLPVFSICEPLLS